MDLARFCFRQPGVYLIPAEHLTDRGLSDAFAEALGRERGVSGADIAFFNEAFALHRARAADLHRRAPGSWMPPRKVNIVVATDPTRARPYSAPFLGTSWFLYASDLDPARSHVEYAAFQMLHVERLAFLGELRAAVAFNMGYWLERTEQEVAAFSDAARRAKRPDAAAFQALGRALPWVRELYHVPLRPPPSPAPEPLSRIAGADLLVPRRLQAELYVLMQSFEAAVQAAEERYLTAQRVAPRVELPGLRRAAPARPKDPGRGPADELCEWLAEERPDVVIVDASGAARWRPEAAGDTAELRRALTGIPPLAADSLRADWQVISDRSRAVVASLRDPEVLPRVSAEIETAGGVYIRADLRKIVYDLKQPGFDPLREEAPPFHRLLLATRTVHEWGHLAHEARLVRVPDAKRAAYDEALRAMEARYDEIVRAMPARLSDEVRSDLASMEGRAGEDGGPGRVLARFTLDRIGDFAANLLARRYLREEELEAYIRANARHHLAEDLGPLAQLTRHTLEVQYLRLSSIADPIGYFFETSWFGEYFLRTGVFAEDAVRALFDAMADLCATYEVDESAFAPRTPPTPPDVGDERGGGSP